MNVCSTDDLRSNANAEELRVGRQNTVLSNAERELTSPIMCDEV